MREVFTLVYCDNKRRHGEEKVEAIAETTVGHEGRAYTLDLCETCNNALLADLAGWAEQGTLVTRTKQRGGQASPSRSPENPPPPCPVQVERDGQQVACGVQRRTRHQLATHIRQDHEKSIKDFPDL